MPNKEKRTWFTRQDEIWEADGFTSTERLVLLALNRYANDKGAAWPKIATLARLTCLSRRTVQRVLCTLVERGEVRRERGDDRYGSATYIILTRGALVTPLTSARGATVSHQGRNCVPSGAQLSTARGATGTPPTELSMELSKEQSRELAQQGRTGDAPDEQREQQGRNRDAPAPTPQAARREPPQGSPKRSEAAGHPSAPNEDHAALWGAYWGSPEPLPSPAMLDAAYDAACQWITEARGSAVSPVRGEHTVVRRWVVGECVEDEGRVRAEVVPEAAARLKGQRPGKSSVRYLLGFLKNEITEVLVPAPERDLRPEWERDEDESFGSAMDILSRDP
jgi:hypothetical protein